MRFFKDFEDAISTHTGMTASDCEEPNIDQPDQKPEPEPEPEPEARQSQSQAKSQLQRFLNRPFAIGSTGRFECLTLFMSGGLNIGGAIGWLRRNFSKWKRQLTSIFCQRIGLWGWWWNFIFDCRTRFGG